MGDNRGQADLFNHLHNVQDEAAPVEMYQNFRGKLNIVLSLSVCVGSVPRPSYAVN